MLSPLSYLAVFFPLICQVYVIAERKTIGHLYIAGMRIFTKAFIIVLLSVVATCGYSQAKKSTSKTSKNTKGKTTSTTKSKSTTGKTGPTGATGAKGATGSTGATGATGAT